MRRAKSRWALACAGASLCVVPSPAVASSNSVWDIIDQYTDTFEDIVLISGQAYNLDQCGNGAPYFTAFVPQDQFLDAYLRSQKSSIAELDGDPALAERIVGDHIANGNLSPVNMVDPTIFHISTWTGRALAKTLSEDLPIQPEVGINVLVNDQFIIYYINGCNGIVYFLYGDTYGPAGADVSRRVAPDPVNFAGAPELASTPERADYPGGVVSGLPDTH